METALGFDAEKKAALDGFFERMLGEKCSWFCAVLHEDSTARYYKLYAWEGRVCIEADSIPHIALGLYRYLRDFWQVNYSWCGNEQLDLRGKALILPQTALYEPVRPQYVSMFNYCTYGYSMAYWDWARWEKELDFLLLNGVNLPLFAVGIEAVWYELLLENGIEKETALAAISSPVHMPWQLMTNIEGVMPAMSEALILQRCALGKRIMERMLSLGMTPIQQGFSGFVPRALARKYPDAVVQKKSWCGHEGTFEVLPESPLFQKLGLSFLRIQKALFGAHHFYAGDPFHESEPPKEGASYLAEVSIAIQNMYQSFDAQYHWVMQSWSLREALVRAAPKEHVLILDLEGKKHKETDGFWGYPFVSGNLHNFGGRINLHGDLPLLAENPYEKLRVYPNAVGTGLFMEGMEQNPLYYELAFQMLTRNGAVDLKQWLFDYAKRRYGSDDENVTKGLLLLAKAAYKRGTNGVEKSSMVCARPALCVKKSGPNEGFYIPYRSEELLEALEAYLEAWDESRKDGYAFDLCDVARQLVSNTLQDISKDICVSYEKKDWEAFLRATNTFMELLARLDALLLRWEVYSLPAHLKRAAYYTDDAKVNAHLVRTLRTLVTLWSDLPCPEIFDYAWREWGGLIGTFYAKRWALFFSYLKQSFFLPKRYDLKGEQALWQVYGREAFEANAFYKDLGTFERDWTNQAYEEDDAASDKSIKQLSEEIRETIRRYNDGRA